MKRIKVGDHTLLVNGTGLPQSIRNRIPNEEAIFAMDMIQKWGLYNRDMKPEEAVERAFKIARLTFEHIKQNRMDVPFPFEKVYGEKE